MKPQSSKPNEIANCAAAGRAGWVTVSLALMVLSGCGGDNWHARTYPASGQITINGQPPEGAVVTLHPTGEKVDERGSQPWGLVGADGSYELSTYEKGDGAPEGEYAVTVKWPLDVNDMAAAMVDRLGGAYATRERSQWKVTIEQRTNELPPIVIERAKLKSDRDVKTNRKAPPMPGMQAK